MWECPPEKLSNGRIVYRCNYGHFHSYPSAAWSCGGPDDRKPADPSPTTPESPTDQAGTPGTEHHTDGSRTNG